MINNDTLKDIPRLKTEMQRLKVALESSYAKLIIEKHKNRSHGDIALGVHWSDNRYNCSKHEKNDPPIRAFREVRSKTEVELCNTAALKGAQYATELLCHEAKQPIAAAYNYLNLLKIKMEKNQKDYPFTEVVGYIENELQRTISVLEKSRNIWHCPDERVKFSMRDIIMQVHCIIDREIRTADGNLEMDLDDANDDVLVDPTQIKHVIQNLIRNSVEAFNKEESTIHMSTSVGSDSVTVVIVDNGSGIDCMHKDTFQPFDSTKKRGSGLGLFLCSSIVKSHSGTIILEPGVETGTIARFSLPLYSRTH